MAGCQRTDSQELELKRYCRQRGWDNLTFFTDRISGANASRPELDKLMHRVRAGEVERLVVYKLDRLGRSLTHLALMPFGNSFGFEGLTVLRGR